MFELSFSSYIVEEPTWRNTTQIKIVYSKPPCLMTQAEIDSSAAKILPINFSGTREVDGEKIDLTEILKNANSAFKID